MKHMAQDKMLDTPSFETIVERVDRKTGKRTDMDYDDKTNSLRGATPKLPRVPYRAVEPAGRGSYKKPVARKVARSGSRGGGR